MYGLKVLTNIEESGHGNPYKYMHDHFKINMKPDREPVRGLQCLPGCVFIIAEAEQNNDSQK